VCGSDIDEDKTYNIYKNACCTSIWAKHAKIVDMVIVSIEVILGQVVPDKVYNI